MEKSVDYLARTRRRTMAVALFVLAIFALYAIRLFQIQIVNSDDYASQGDSTTEIQLPISATRGEILDRDLNPLVVNTTAYAILFDYSYWPRGTSEVARARQNTIILTLTTRLTEAGEEWTDSLPLSGSAPYSFSDDSESEITVLRSYLRLADYATADNCMAALIERYELSAYTAVQQRILAGVQYSMERSDFSTSNPYTFAASVSKQTSYDINEQSSTLPGVNVRLTPVRSYVNGDLASHLIGRVGLLSVDEYETYKSEGYSYNDVIGKFGIEQAEESSLRGVDGVRTLTKDSDGTVLEEKVTTDPVPGSTVILTLDSSLQEAAQTTLNDIITEFRALDKGSDNGHDIGSGSVVMLDVSDGSVLVAATWPNYTLSDYYSSYSELLNQEDNPLFNRALYGAFTPGSTFKVSVSVAAMAAGIISPTDTISCTGAFTYYRDSGLTIRCMGVHGSINIVTALGKSCNAYFCELGRRTGIATMNDYARQMGLGVATGIEVGESTGCLAGPDERESAGGTWLAADTSQAAIGQSDNTFTPLQLAAYAMTIANRGTRYQTHLVRAVMDYSGVVSVKEPVVAYQMDVSDDVWDAIASGMELTVSNGTATRFFNGVSYTLAAKTGTAEAGNGGSDHGVFIGYAPADDPQVAIAVVMENGTSSAAARTARKMLDAYFANSETTSADSDPGVLLG